MAEKVATETPVMKARSNPWMISTLVLGVLLIGFVAFTISGSGITGNVVGSSSVGQNVVDYLNGKTGGGVTLDSVTKENGFYKIMVTYQAKQLPVYATLDGKNLISDLIPLDGSTDSGTTDVGSTGTVTIDAQKLSAAPMEGNKDAKVQVVEFSDFQCPFCGKFYSDAYSQLKKDYIDTGKIAFYFMDFPLSFHPNAPKAAEAAHCAADQKGNVGFFQMHNKLFDNNALLNSASTDEALKSYKQWARDLNLDGSAFDSCLDSGKYTSLVSDFEAYGQTLGVTGTPSFFINGKSLVGAQPYSAFKQMIDAELAASA